MAVFVPPHFIVWSDYLPDILPHWAGKAFFLFFPFTTIYLLPPLFCLLCFILLFITTCSTGFYLFVLCSSLLSTSSVTLMLALSSVIESGVSWLCMWYFYHAVVLGYDFPLLLFFLDYMFINQVLSFPLPLCCCECSVSLYHTS
jgi:hypothetical protein